MIMGIIYEPKGRALEYSLLAVNHYVGCGHGCTYCFAAAMSKRFGNDWFHTSPHPKYGMLSKLRKEAPKFAGTDKRVLLSFMTDPYQPLDVVLEFTRSVLKILKANNIPFQILTKGGMRAQRDFDLYGTGDVFATTMTFLDDKRSTEFEPNAATPKDRIASLAAAKAAQIETWVSLEPVLDAAASVEIIARTAAVVDLFKVGKLNHQKTSTDWRRFGIKAIEACEQIGVKYYVKNDLANYLGGVEFTNTDSRKVVRS